MAGRNVTTLIAALIGGLWGAAVYFGHARGHLKIIDRVESTMTDLRTLARGVQVVPDFVTIVAIDDTMVNQGGSYPVPRADLARIVEAIASHGPKVIAIDLLLLDQGPDEGDDALARSLSGQPGVIAAAAVFDEASQSIGTKSEGPLAQLPVAARLLLPLKKFADLAEIGIVNVTTDQSGTPNAVPMLFRTRDSIETSFALRVAARAIGKEPVIEPHRILVGGRSVITEADHALPLTFYGPRQTVPTVGAASVLAGAGVNSIRDRIVVIGATVTGGGDFFPTPFDPVMPGVEVAATAITHLMAGDGMRRDRSVRIADGVVTIVLPVILVGLIGWRRTSAGLLATFAVLLGCLAVNVLAFSNGIWLSAALPIASVVPPAILFAGVQLWWASHRAQYLVARNVLLEQFQAPDIQQWLTQNPDFLKEPVRQDAAVVFIDLSGFTSLSERLGPAPIRELLKDFYALIDAEAVSSGGMITGFLGDGAMMLFGLPKPAPDDAFRAARCAAGLCVSAERWLASLPQSIRSRLGFKVGGHFGTLVASRLGGSYHHITATGDTVNVASRLMEVAAGHGVSLAVSDELLRAAGRDGALFETGALTGPIPARIRGRSASLLVWLWQIRAAGS